MQLHEFFPLLSELMMLGNSGSHISVSMIGGDLDRPLTLEVLQVELDTQLHQVDRHVTLVAPRCPVQRRPLQSVLVVQLRSTLVQ